MASSLFIGQLIGPITVIIAVSALLNFKSYLRMIDDFQKNSALLYLAGIFGLFVGLLIVLTHNIWISSWIVIITIFGWISLIKGLVLILFPDWATSQVKFWKKNAETMKYMMVAMLLIGLYVSYMSFWA